MTTAPALRPATRRDQAAVERLLADSGLPTDGIAGLFAAHPEDFVVADAPGGAGEVVAVAGLERCGDHALLRSVAVRPEWRGHGLGEALVRRLVDEGERRGVRALYLLTTTAERWFPRFGFHVVSRDLVPAAVRATGEFAGACPASATVMARPLGAAVPPG